MASLFGISSRINNTLFGRIKQLGSMSNRYQAYLEEVTKNRYFQACPELKERQGHQWLRTSRVCWHEEFSDCLHALGLSPLKA